MGQEDRERVSGASNVRQGLRGKRLLKGLANGLQKEQSYSASLAACRNLLFPQSSQWSSYKGLCLSPEQSSHWKTLNELLRLRQMVCHWRLVCVGWVQEWILCISISPMLGEGCNR